MRKETANERFEKGQNASGSSTSFVLSKNDKKTGGMGRKSTIWKLGKQESFCILLANAKGNDADDDDDDDGDDAVPTDGGVPLRNRCD